MFNRILAAIDFEKMANEVVSYAGYFAIKTGCYIYFVNVIDYIVTPPSYVMKYIDEEKKIIKEKFSSIENELKKYNINCELDIVVGRLQESFERSILDKSPQMLIIGFTRHQFRRSSSEKLIKSLKIPMLVVKGESFDAININNISIKKILCPVDMSEHSKKALIFSIELSKLLSAELTPITIIQSWSIKNKFKYIDELNNYSKKLLEEIKKTYQDFLDKLNCIDKGVMIEGDPYKDIVNYANEKDFDLIVMGARGLGLVKGLFIGSVTDCVLKTSNCPVFVIH